MSSTSTPRRVSICMNRAVTVCSNRSRPSGGARLPSAMSAAGRCQTLDSLHRHAPATAAGRTRGSLHAASRGSVGGLARGSRGAAGRGGQHHAGGHDRRRQPAGRGGAGAPGRGEVLRRGRGLRRPPPARPGEPQLHRCAAGRQRPLGRRSPLGLRLPRSGAAGHPLHGEAARRLGAAGGGGATDRAHRFRLQHRRARDRAGEPLRRRQDRGRPAPAAAAQRPGRRGHCAGPCVVRGRRPRRTPAGATGGRRGARRGAEGAPPDRHACSECAAAALPAPAAQRCGGAPGLGRRHRRGGRPEGRHHGAAGAQLPGACGLQRRVPLRARTRRRRLPADPADEPALLVARAARARGPVAAGAGRRHAARAGVRQGRQGGRGARDPLPGAAARERALQARDAEGDARHRRPGAGECRQLSAGDRHRRRAADREVRRRAFRHRRERRPGRPAHPAPSARRAARRRRARQADRRRCRHPELVPEDRALPRAHDDRARGRPARIAVDDGGARAGRARPHRGAPRRTQRRHPRAVAAEHAGRCEAARTAPASGRRSAPLRGGRHPARRTRLPPDRDRVAPARRGPARTPGADVRAQRRARDQPRRALQARAREQPRLGDHA